MKFDKIISLGKLRFREGVDSREGKEKKDARGESEGKELRKRLKMVREAQPEIEKPRKKNFSLGSILFSFNSLLASVNLKIFCRRHCRFLMTLGSFEKPTEISIPLSPGNV